VSPCKNAPGPHCFLSGLVSTLHHPGYLGPPWRMGRKTAGAWRRPIIVFLEFGVSFPASDTLRRSHADDPDHCGGLGLRSRCEPVTSRCAGVRISEKRESSASESYSSPRVGFIAAGEPAKHLHQHLVTTGFPSSEHSCSRYTPRRQSFDNLLTTRAHPR
jgi:hypothetical protein